MKNPTIIIRSLIRYDCQASKAMSHYLNGLVDAIEAQGCALSEHIVNIEYGLLDRYHLQAAEMPVLVFERNGLEVARLKGVTAPEEILDVLAHAKAVR